MRHLVRLEVPDAGSIEVDGVDIVPLRELEMAKVPYVVVVGDKEMDSGEVSVRARHGQDLGSLNQDALLETLASAVARKGRTQAD